MLLLVFLIAAGLTLAGGYISQKIRKPGWPQPEGVFFVSVVAVATAVGLIIFYGRGNGGSDRIYTSIDQLQSQPLLAPDFTSGLALVGFMLGVYALSALRGIGKLPAWLADVIVILAAIGAVFAEPDSRIQLFTSTRADAPELPLGQLAIPLTVFWIWLTARLSAALNRVPMVAGGYLGVVALAGLLLLSQHSQNPSQFPWMANAALAGAGLASFIVALRNRSFNLGWSATLAVGFLLGCSSAVGLLKASIPGVLTLAVLALGLPLLDVSFFRLRATLRGQKVDWMETRLRLHEALQSRGVAPVKIGLLYMAIGLWFSALAYFAARWLFLDTPGLLVASLVTIVLLALAVTGGIVFFSLARLLMRRRADEEVPESLDAFGVRITPVSMQEAMARIEGFIHEGRRSGKCHHVVTSDANAILTSKQDEHYAEIIRNAALITPDGFGVIWGARLLNLPIYERVTGVDMVTGICDTAARNGFKVFILGSEPGIAATAAQNLMTRYPGLNIVGTHHGMIIRDEELKASVLRQIKEAKPDVLFVAMGIPLQEKFIAQYKEELGIPVLLGVGGSFDVYAGKFNRAPQYVQRMGLEWLYRVWIDPSRWKRMGYVPKFMVVALKTWLFGAGKNSKAADAF